MEGNRLVYSLNFCGTSRGLNYVQRIFLTLPLYKEVGPLLLCTCLVKVQALAFAKGAQSKKKLNESGKVAGE